MPKGRITRLLTTPLIGEPAKSLLFVVMFVGAIVFSWVQFGGWGAVLLTAIFGIGILGTLGPVVELLLRLGHKRAMNRRQAGLCPRCGYDQRGIPANRCPECGYWYAGGVVRPKSDS